MVKSLKVSPKIKPSVLRFPAIPVFNYDKSISSEIKDGTLNRENCLGLLEQMMMIRALEEMIEGIVAGIYKPLPDFKYVGPTHLSIGQEATSVGSISALDGKDYITSSHRGHGDSLAKGFCAIKLMSDDELREHLSKKKHFLSAINEDFNSKDSRAYLEEKAIKVHVYRMIAELFGKEDGYCRGVGGGMHIADFELGHLGANAIVGGHMGIAAGAAISCRYKKNNRVVLCLAGDGAYSNGISHESMNLASMAQFSNGLMSKKFGVPIIFGVVNNQYAMSGQEVGEITGVDFISRRAAAYNLDAMHAEVVDGMNVLAVLDAVKRALDILKDGKGPVLLEFMTYRFKGHSLSDPLTYRDREELEEWKSIDPIMQFIDKLLAADFPEDKGGKIKIEEVDTLKEKVYSRNAVLSIFAAKAGPPAESTLLDYVYAPENEAALISGSYSLNSKKIAHCARNSNGEITYRLAVREGLMDEMAVDENVILFGEDVADYGGAFGVTGELLNTFGRDRVFNTSISESGIVGAAVGMAMTGLKPVAEIMYSDFILEAMDQIGNQAAKWSYMSGGQISIPILLRTTIGGGKGYAGQHSQSLEAIAAHMPGLIVIAPSSPYDVKGLIKSSIRSANPVIFFEHQLLYNALGVVPEEEYIVPIGKAKILRDGTDITVISWSYMVTEAVKAAMVLEKQGINAEIIDLRTLVPLDIDTILNSVKKTGRVLIASQAVSICNFAAEIITQLQEKAFDYLDSPVRRLCAPNGIPPTSQKLENLFMVNAEKIVESVKEIFK
jgi:2-oxoisovalerate dehydrogenase E1 component